MFPISKPPHPRLVRLKHLRRFATFAWGNNDHNQLALPFSDTPSSYASYGQNHISPLKIPFFQHYNLLSLSSSLAHSAFVRGDGQLYTAGFNNSGQLGKGQNVGNGIVKLGGLPLVCDVACGSRHTLVLSVDGVVYAFGEGGTGKLGAQGGVIDAFLRGGNRIVAIGAGDDFSVAVCSEGGVYTWGNGQRGKLGHGRVHGFGPWIANEEEPQPRRVAPLRGVKVHKVFVGKRQVVCLDREGKAYGWGCGSGFVLGNGSEEQIWQPVECFSGLTLEKVDFGGVHTLALTKGGNVFTVGSNEYGCLGMGYEGNVSVAVEPIQVAGLRHVVDVGAGRAISALVIGKGKDGLGEVWTWGCGEQGALGNGDVVDHWAPVKIGLKAQRVVIGNAASSVFAF